MIITVSFIVEIPTAFEWLCFLFKIFVHVGVNVRYICQSNYELQERNEEFWFAKEMKRLPVNTY